MLLMRRCLVVALLALTACGSQSRGARDKPAQDGAGGGANDAGSGGADAGQGGADAGSGSADAGQGGADAGSGGADAGCIVTFSQLDQTGVVTSSTATYEYDPGTRRLVTSSTIYDLDEQERVASMYFNTERGPEWMLTNQYDEHGNLATRTNSVGTETFVNTYDGDRLVVAERTGPVLPGRTSYSYEDAAVPDLWTRRADDVAAENFFDFTHDRTFVDGRVSRIDCFSENGGIEGNWQYFYAGDEIAFMERDGCAGQLNPPDGSADMRIEWLRDGGVVTGFTRDGSDSNDKPEIDGVPDYAESYSAGCSELFDRFPWLAHEPGPESVGPRNRDDRH